MKSKRFLAAVLILAMTFSVSTTALATVVDNSSVQKTVNAEVVMETPTIKVTITPPGDVLVNPYQLEYSYPDGANLADNSTIISNPCVIKNESNVNLELGVTPKIERLDATSQVEFLTAGPTQAQKDAEAPTVFAYVELRDNSDNDTAPDSGWADNYSGTNGKMAVAKTSAAFDEAKINLPKAGGTKDVPSAKYIAYRIDGDTGGTRWLNTDTFKITLVFSFNPVADFTA